MIEANIIGFSTSAEGASYTQGFNPSTGEALDGSFYRATPNEVNRAVDQAVMAFNIYGKVSGKEKAVFLNAIADEIENLGDELIERCCAESGLPKVRIQGERARTTGQLRMFATLVAEGSWLEAVIDTAQPDRAPVPKPDIRRMLVPIGPVVVFAASNFPLAFSTAGGDTASALAGGNPVIIKAHSAHPGTSALVGSAIVKAARNTGMPDGVFSLLHGSGKVVGQGLINHPGVKAAGFTGSQTAGRILYDLANQRPEPIPFFAEMGSVNPVILFPSALNSNTVQMLTDSITMGAGQFCTNPGLLLSIKGVNLDQFIIELGESLSQVSPGVMLTEKILKTYNSDAATATSNKEVTVETIVQSENKSNRGAAILVSISGESFINNPDLAIEIFGPYSMVVKCEDKNQLIEVISNLDGQLTGSVLGTPDESINFSKVIDRLEKKVGRLIFNGVPTGVEVCPSMQHGGPYPAATDVRFSSVGTMSIKRFVRPVAYQSWPDNQLPDELKDDNPLKIWRLVNSEFTKS